MAWQDVNDYSAMLAQLGAPAASDVPPADSVLPLTRRARAEAARRRQAELEAAPVDMTAYQEFAKRQAEMGRGSLMNALAAQYAGERFQPVQAQLLRQAAAAQEPMKLGRGMITPDGKFLDDPFAQREAQVKRLSTQAQLDEAAADRMDALEAARKEQARRDAEARDFRREMAANRPVDNSKQWRGEDALRNDYEKLTKDLREEVGATGKIMQIVSATPPGQKPDAITQQSLVILLNKFLDPGSVVREGEFDRVVKAQGMLGQAQNLSDRILRGQPLDANTIQQINGLAQFYNQAAQTKMRTIAQQQMEIANRRGLNVENVISDPSMRAPAAAPAAGGAPDLAAAARAELERRKKGNKP